MGGPGIYVWWRLTGTSPVQAAPAFGVRVKFNLVQAPPPANPSVLVARTVGAEPSELHDSRDTVILAGLGPLTNRYP
eukprot:SAG22_NODE_99_length_20560_cov_128.669029_18_plen_77_part_00